MRFLRSSHGLFSVQPLASTHPQTIAEMAFRLEVPGPKAAGLAQFVADWKHIKEVFHVEERNYNRDTVCFLLTRDKTQQCHVCLQL